jgi:superfamily II helicase
LKSINSPTYDILNIIKNNKTTKRDLIVKIKKKKIIKKRIKDLINQGIIQKQRELKLTPFGIIVVKFFIIIKKNFKLRVEG